MMRTQVGIVGAGPAGLMLSHLLALEGIASIVIESHTRDYVEHRIRAGLMEHFSVELLRQSGVGARMDREGLVHHGIVLRFGGGSHRIPVTDLTGKSMMIYGQHEVVKDLIAARLGGGGRILFEAEAVGIDDIDTDRPRIRFRHEARDQQIECDFIAGCDGFHGICRPALGDAVTFYDKHYPFGWLGILAEAAPSSEALVYTCHERGFALFSMRSPRITRLYFQVPPDEDIETWPDEAIWEEMLKRMTTEDGWKPNVGPVLNKNVTAMRSFVTEPMNAGRLYLAGDAAHIVPPTGAKGLNLAAADVLLLARALTAFYRTGKTDLLGRYSDTALKRVWRSQRFSWWMTQTLHLSPEGNAFDFKRQLTDLDYITSSKAALTSLAENYVGLPMETEF
jgi:p-hydroxybenzoate 3-monooxygenase